VGASGGRPATSRIGQEGTMSARHGRVESGSGTHSRTASPKLTKIVAVANQKGGVGKTTTAINLAGSLAEQGYRVLCVDMDPQANLTVGLGINLRTVERSMAEALTEPETSLEDIVVPTQTSGIDVAPATIDLSAAENTLFTSIGREQALRDVLSGWALDHYDYVLIDCPPTLGLLTINGLVAAHGVIIPVQTQYYALKGFTALVNVITQIRSKGLNSDLRILGLLPTFFDGRTLLGRDMLLEMRELGDHHIFENMIKQTVRLGEAPLVGRPVTSYATNSEAARIYRGLAREVIELG
jgi:chromosome partitioning protein